MQKLHVDVAAREKIFGSPATDLIQQWAKEDASEIQHACVLEHAYNQDATARAHKLRRILALFEGIALSEKTCVHEWDRTGEIERERARTIIGVKQTLQKEEANSSHPQVNTKNTKEEAHTSRARAIDRDIQVHPSPPRKKATLQACGSRDEDIKGLSTLCVDKTQALLGELMNEDTETTFQAFLKSEGGSHLTEQVQIDDDHKTGGGVERIIINNHNTTHYKEVEPAPPNTIPRPGSGTRADRHVVPPCADGTVLYCGPCELGTGRVRHECENGVIGDKIIYGVVDNNKDTNPKDGPPAIFPPPKVTFEDTAHLQNQLAQAELFFDGDGHWDYQAEEEADKTLQIASDLHYLHEEVQAEIQSDQAYEAVHLDHPPPHLRVQNELRQAEEETKFEKAEKVPLAHSSSSSSSGKPTSGDRRATRQQKQNEVETKIDDSHAPAISFLTNLHNEGKLEAPPRPRLASGTGPRKESVVKRKEEEQRQRKAARTDGRCLHQHKGFESPAAERKYLSDHLDELWRISGADPSFLKWVINHKSK
jgi:hypothetical protein